MKKTNENKDLEISILSKKLENVEKKAKGKFDNLKEKNYRLDESHLDESKVNLENSVKALEKELFKCEHCKFTTESKCGLKIHNNKQETA